MKNHSTINLLGGSIRYWGGVESDCRINTKNYYHDRIYNTSSARKRLVLHPQRHLTWCAYGLEPGHSKTMMAAFIIAIKGTIKQAVMLGLAATISHTAVVWLIAFGGMVISKRFTAQSAEPWLQLISAVIIISTAFWMFWRTWVLANATGWRICTSMIRASSPRSRRSPRPWTSSPSRTWRVSGCPCTSPCQ